ncbi:hypothetical protein Tco_1252121 [Tanacetum coccineum]
MDAEEKSWDSERQSQIYCGQFISKLARKCMVLTEDVVRSLSALVYCVDMDTNYTYRFDLILMDLYDRMGRMEIRQEAIERIEYRQSYHWDRYQGVFEHMAGVYSVPIQGSYNPPGYQQYLPAPPQYQQQQQQDNEL